MIYSVVKTAFLAFREITPEWLERFGRNQKRLGNSTNTIAIHYRNIRALYNKAIDREKISQDSYPFRRFKIPSEKPRKRSLTIEEIRKIRDVNLDKKSWQISRDLFMLSFYMIGINFKDLLLAKNTDIIDGRLEFKREKTKRPYSIKIVPEAQAIIDRYPGDDHLLGFIERKRLVNEKKDRSTSMYKDITDQVNRLLKDVAKAAKVNKPSRPIMLGTVGLPSPGTMEYKKKISRLLWVMERMLPMAISIWTSGG